MHNGGISAVAIATPGITLLDFLRVNPTIPAIPPTSAIITSQIVGLVLAKISLPAVVIGVIVKYTVDVTTLIIIEIINTLIDFLIRFESTVATPYPIPIIEPIKGEINIAPIITATEFIFKPIEAIIIAHINIIKLEPYILTPSNIFSCISSLVA